MLGVIVMISPLTRHSFLLSSSTGVVRGGGGDVWAVWLAAKQPITGRRAGYAAPRGRTRVHVFDPQRVHGAVKHDPLLVRRGVLQERAMSGDEDSLCVFGGQWGVGLCGGPRRLLPATGSTHRCKVCLAGGAQRSRQRPDCRQPPTVAASRMQHASTPSVHSWVTSSNWPYSWPMVIDLGLSTQVRTWGVQKRPSAAAPAVLLARVPAAAIAFRQALDGTSRRQTVCHTFSYAAWPLALSALIARASVRYAAVLPAMVAPTSISP